MWLPLLGFALYLAPAVAAIVVCARMKKRTTRHEVAAICAGIAVFVPPASFFDPDRFYGFWALVALLAATSLCLARPPFKTDLPGGFVLRVVSVFACAVYLFLFSNMGGIDFKPHSMSR